MLTGPTFIPEVVTSAIVLMHGFGSDGKDLMGLAPYVSNAFPQAAIYAPNGVSVTPHGMGYQWFSDNDWTFKDRPGMDIAMNKLDEYLTHIETEHKIQRDKIVLMSFSQGTMTALFAAPRMEKSVAGVVGMSGRMFWDEELEGQAYHKIPVRLIHGTHDDVVDPDSAPEATKRLKALGFDVDYTMIPDLGHGIDERALSAAIEAIGSMLK